MGSFYQRAIPLAFTDGRHRGTHICVLCVLFHVLLIRQKPCLGLVVSSAKLLVFLLRSTLPLPPSAPSEESSSALSARSTHFKATPSVWSSCKAGGWQSLCHCGCPAAEEEPTAQCRQKAGPPAHWESKAGTAD